MRHKNKGRKLGSGYSHTKAIKVSLAKALFLNDRIKTTVTRAKEMRTLVDKVITWAKRGDLHSRRLAIAALGNDKELVREIFEKVSQGMFEGRNGGYTRIMKLGPRKGDGAPMCIIELVTETCVPKAERKAAGTKAKATPKKRATKKDAAKKAEKAEPQESVAEELKESIEAAIENESENIREDGERQLAEERAEVEKEDAEAEAKDSAKAAKKAKADDSAEEKAEEKADAKEAEKVVEEEFKAEEERAEDREAERGPIDEGPDSEERAK